MKKTVKNVIQRNIRILIISIKMNVKLFVIQIADIMMNNIMLFINLIMPKYLIQALMKGAYGQILYILSLMLGINLIGGLIELKVTPYVSLMMEKINIRVVNQFLEKSYSLKISYFDDSKSYDKYTIVFDNCCSIITNSKNTFLQLISAVVQIVTVVAILDWISIWILLLMLVVILINLLIAQNVKKIQYEYQKAITTQNRQLNFIYRLFYLPQFIRDIRINSIKDFIFKKKDRYSNEFLEQFICNNKRLSKITFVQKVISSIESFLVMGYFVLEYLRKKIWIDDFFVAINAYNSLKEAISNIFSLYNNLYENDLYLSDYIEFMESQSIEENQGRKKICASEIESIEFKSVYFKYPNSNEYALKDISFRINKGEKVIIVGGNGAGKTTIVKLLIRLYDIDHGSILINQVDITEYEIKSLRKAFAILFQDYSIYPFSIKENVSLGETVEDNDIIEALRKVDMIDRISKLSQGIDTPITSQLSEAGVEFSGGENQRIAIARMLIRKDCILVLDEPTSNLDPIIEYQLYVSLLDEKIKNTLLIISHRLTFSHKMEKIICLSDGSIVEMGTHDELISIDGYYKNLYELSTLKYVNKIE